jgi:hypothetical protein
VSFLVENVDGLHDCFKGRIAREKLDAQTIVEESGDALFETVEGGDGILANGEKEMNGDLLLAQDAGKFRGKRVFAVFVGVVLEILFKLVKDHKESAIDGDKAGFEAVEKALVGSGASVGLVTGQAREFFFNGGVEAGDGIISPGTGSAKVNEEIVGIVLEIVGDAGAENGAFAGAARSIKDSEAGGSKIVANQAALGIAAKEVAGILFAIREQSFVGAELHGS